MYPIRSESHIKEKIGICKLKNILPEEWILRDIQERDYGLDALLQVTKENTNEVLPYNIGVQIKYRENIDAPLIIKASTYNYLHNGNTPNFLFVTNEAYSKICCISWISLNCKGENCSIPDNLFYKIDNQQNLINYICYYTHLLINKDKFKYDVLKSYNDFNELYDALKKNNIEYLWNYYQKNIKRIHNILIDLQFGIVYFDDFLNIDTSIKKLRVPYEKKDIYMIMLLFLTCIYLESEKLEEILDASIRKDLQRMLINCRNRT